MGFDMTQAQEMMTQMQKTAGKMRKTTTQMNNMMAQMNNMMDQMKNMTAQVHNLNNINFTGLAQYLQAVGGVFNAMAQYESQMYQFFSGQTKP